MIQNNEVKKQRCGQPETPFLVASVLLALIFVCYFSFQAMAVSISLGDDSFYAMAAPGRFLQQTFPKDFFIGLVSSFRGEDHLFPLYYVFGFLSEAISLDSQWNMKVATKILLLLYGVSFSFLVLKISKKPLVAVLFWVLFCFNLNLTWRPMITFSGIGFSPHFGILVFYFLWKIVRDNAKTRKSFIFLFLSSFLMTMGFETSFAHLGFFGAFVVLYILIERGLCRSSMLKILAIGSILSLSLLPYFSIHWYVFESLMPISRNHGSHWGLVLILERLRSFMEATFFEPYLFLGRNLIYFIMLLAPMLVYFLRLGSNWGMAVYGGFLFTLVGVLFAGRAEHGMWFFSGTLVLMVYADCIGGIISKLDQLLRKWRVLTEFTKSFLRGGIVFLISILLAHCSYRVNAFARYSEAFYGSAGRSQDAFSSAIGEARRVFQLISIDPKNPIARREEIWAANQMFYGDLSLKLVPEKFLFSPLGLTVYAKTDSLSCAQLAFGAKELSGVFQGEPIILRSASGYQRYSLKGNSVQRFVPFSGERVPYEICLREGGASPSRVRLYLQTASSETATLFVDHASKSVSFNRFGEAEFLVANGFSHSLVIDPGELDIAKVEVEQEQFRDSEHPKGSDFRLWNFSAKEMNCQLTIESENGSTALVLPRGESVFYEHPYGGSSFLSIEQIAVEIPKKGIRRRRVIKIAPYPNDDESNELNLCGDFI